jgi:hypothetical protein
MTLNWGPWIYGLLGGFIGGGAAAASTGIAQVVTDPQHSDIHHLLILMGVSYFVGGVITSLAFLKQSPLPPPVVVTTTASTTILTPATDTAPAHAETKTTTVAATVEKQP